MLPHKKIPIWINASRLKKLKVFRNEVVHYFNNSRLDMIGEERIEQERAKQSRITLNKMMREIFEIIAAAEVIPVLRWTPPAMIGGYVQNIDVIGNLFNLDRYEISPNVVIDYLDRTIGIYESNTTGSVLRTFNPFYYVGLIFDYLVELPFIFIGKIGLNREKAESSLIGKLVKASLYLVTVTASLLTILELLDYLDPVKKFIKTLIG